MSIKRYFASAALALAVVSVISLPGTAAPSASVESCAPICAVAPLHERVQSAVDYIRTQTPLVPEFAVVLGSGFDKAAELIENPVTIPYGKIPGFCVSTAPGHDGKLVFGTIEGRNVVMMRGRLHLYEGYTPQQVVFPIQVMSGLGVKNVIVSNASGAIRNDLALGELMIIKDHINMTGVNPCVGPNDAKVGPRFFPVSSFYDKKMRTLANQVADNAGFKLSEGVYVGMLGPSYETAAENRMLSQMGGDAVGMSTVLEIIEAAHCGMKIFGVTCISDVLNDEDSEDMEQYVIEVGKKACKNFETLLRGILKEYK